MKRAKVFKGIILFWCLFIGIGAVCGALSMFIDPTGKTFGYEVLLTGLRKLPFADVLFQNLVFSGISLLIVNGITNIVASILIIKNKKIGYVFGFTFGFTLMLWITIQFFIFESNILSNAYFIFGFLQLICGYIAFVFHQQNTFTFNALDYKNIKQDSKSIVVFFSRTGYTKKIAYEIANKEEAEIFEVKTTQKIKGFLGFMWCGRFGMHHWGMPIENNNIDLSKYERVIIISPVWVFSLCAPMREFLKDKKDKVKKLECYIVHFSISSKSAFKEINTLLNTNEKEYDVLSCHFGRITKTEHKSLI